MAKKARKAPKRIQHAPLQTKHGIPSRRLSLCFVEDLPEGTILQAWYVHSIRAGKGLAPKDLPGILGLHIMQAVKKGDPVTREIFKGPDED